MTKTKRIIGMVLGILFIGLCVSFLRLSQFGVDPFNAMNLGISGFIGWTYRCVKCCCDTLQSDTKRSDNSDEDR